MNLPFELAVDPSLILILASVAFVAGFIDAIAGGGGLLTIPALLMAGLPPHLVLGTNKLSATFGSATAGFTFYRKKLFNPKLWKYGLAFTFIGALLGALIAQKLPAHWLDRILPVIVFACGLYLLFNPSPKVSLNDEIVINRKRQIPQGFTLGFYDGIAGPGTGAFWTISTLMMYPIDLVRASGVARSMNFISNITALSVFIFYGQVAWVLGISMGITMMLGAVLGAKLAIKGGNKLIRPVFIMVVLALTARLAWQHWFN